MLLDIINNLKVISHKLDVFASCETLIKQVEKPPICSSSKHRDASQLRLCM